MGIAIGSNIASLRAQRSLGKSGGVLASSFERLSSGKRINKAADDAAGLTVADNLNVQARLSSVAVRNVNDAVSALSIATGALDSQKRILFRMAELAEQSANGVYSNQQRAAIDGEYQALMLEFDRIASTAAFNGANLLRNPNGGVLQFMVGITGADSSLIQMSGANSHRFSGVYGLRSDWDGNGFINILDSTALATQLQSPDTPRARSQGYATFNLIDSQGQTGTVRLSIHRVTNDLGSATPLSLVSDEPLDVRAYATRSNGETKSVSLTNVVNSDTKSLTVNFTYSASGATGSVTLDLSDTRFLSLDAGTPIRETAIGFTTCMTSQDARRALDTVNNRIEDISALQGEFGALQSRLDLTSSMLQVTGENFRAAESRIRDADIAEDAAMLTRMGILQQAGAAVLGQANQQPALALQLLQ